MRRRNQSTRLFVWVALKVSFAMMLVVWCKISPFCQAFGLKGGPAKSKVPSRRSSSGLWMSTSSADGTAEVPQKIAIVGGGLAGLSTAFHLLEKATQLYPVKSLDLSILDSHPVGTGGASAVAGGLVHPLSPRGKLVHWGREGLEATNYLIDRACQYEQSNSDDIVLRKELFRIATSAKQAKQLQQTAEEMPYLCDWLEPIDLPLGTTTDANNSHNHASSSGIIHGGLRLRNGCKVIYLPSYLQGLWAACQNFETTGTHNVRWEHKDVTKQSYALLEQYDAVVLAAGSGLFDNEQGPGILSPTSSFQNCSSSEYNPILPVQMVRGQSIEFRIATSDKSYHNEALLSGKYISPLPEKGLVLVGATHEFQSNPLSQEQVIEELRERTLSLNPILWNDEANIERFTMGVRVQSQRGAKGRLPLIGRLDPNYFPKGSSLANAWIFTGLSSRGLLYHGVYGALLAQAILDNSEDYLSSNCPGFDWWDLSPK